jgi:hypothetical protein
MHQKHFLNPLERSIEAMDIADETEDHPWQFDPGLAASMDHFISYLERILSSLHPLETARQSQFPSRDSSLVSFGLVFFLFRLYITEALVARGIF